MSSETQYLRDSKKFLSNALEPDIQKLVLPVVMTLLLVSGAFSTLDLQESYGEKSLNVSLEMITELQVLNARNHTFPNSLNRSAKSLQENISDSADKKKNQIRQQSGFRMKGFLSIAVFKSGAFPLVPDKTLAPWGSEKDYVRAISLTRYRSGKIQELVEKANNTENYSYSNFKTDIGEIKQRKWDSEEVQGYLDDQNTTKGSVGLIGQLNYQKVKSDGVSEIGVQSFLPSIFATFILYYLIGAVAVQANRGFNRKVFETRE